MKRCVQCGILKEDEEFRESYYKSKVATVSPNSVTRYRTCRTCESINSRHRTLTKILGDIGAVDTLDESVYLKYSTELDAIENLYKELEARGLRAPKYTSRGYNNSVNLVETTLARVIGAPMSIEERKAFEAKNADILSKPKPIKELLKDIPQDLEVWLGDGWKEKGFEPEYLQETVYESLKAKYRPILSVDVSRGLPKYDDTYKDVLNEILRKFDDYEDEYEQGGGDV